MSVPFTVTFTNYNRRLCELNAVLRNASSLFFPTSFNTKPVLQIFSTLSESAFSLGSKERETECSDDGSSFEETPKESC